jgi:hypothetical protein
MASTKNPLRTILYKNAQFLRLSGLLPKITGRTLEDNLRVETKDGSYRFYEIYFPVKGGLREDQKIVIYFYYPSEESWKENFENFLEESNFEGRRQKLDFLVLVRIEAEDEVITKDDMDMILDKTAAKRTLHVTLNNENKDYLLQMILNEYEIDEEYTESEWQSMQSASRDDKIMLSELM